MKIIWRPPHPSELNSELTYLGSETSILKLISCNLGFVNVLFLVESVNSYIRRTPSPFAEGVMCLVCYVTSGKWHCGPSSNLTSI